MLELERSTSSSLKLQLSSVQAALEKSGADLTTRNAELEGARYKQQAMQVGFV